MSIGFLDHFQHNALYNFKEIPQVMTWRTVGRRKERVRLEQKIKERENENERRQRGREREKKTF